MPVLIASSLLQRSSTFDDEIGTVFWLAQTSSVLTLVHHLSFFLRELFQCCRVSWPVFQGFGTELVNLFHSP